MPYIGNPIYQSAFVTDTFSGNGTTTAFTMSVAPAGTTNVLVAVSGVLQDPSTYGVVGTTLNFSAAPPTGTGNISVRYLGVPATGVTTTAYRTVTEFTATAGQTTFTPPSYTVGFIDVYRNGVLLGSADFTATNGTTIVLANPATAGDLVETISFLVSSVLNAIPNTAGSVSSSNIANDVTINFADGSASTPSITNNGDTNTGIFFPAADTIAFSEGGTEVARFDSAGNLGIGTTSPITRIHADGTGNQNIRVSSSTHSNFVQSFCVSGSTGQEYKSVYRLVDTDAGERMRIDSAGRVLCGYTTSINTNALLQGFSNTTTNSTPAFVWGRSDGYLNGALLNVDNQSWSAVAVGMVIGRVVSSGRSINAAGTVNASGADYAEYMTKAGSFEIAKGDVCGIDANGKLTNVFDDALSFVVKSTDPSYVGGDTWGIGFGDDAEGLEAARQTVDRIAFAGQVPVNVLGATAGQYIVPVNDNGAIKGEAVSNPTFEQYQSAVGKVIAIESDGRAKIIVKVV